MPYMAVMEPEWTNNTSNLADDPYYWLWILKRMVLERQTALGFPANDGSKDPERRISLDHKHSMAEMVAYAVRLYQYKLADTVGPLYADSGKYTDLARYVPPGYPYQTVMGWQKRLALHVFWENGGIWAREFDIPVIQCRQRAAIGWGDTIAEALAAAKEDRKTADTVLVDPPTVAKYRQCAYIELPVGGPKRFYAYLVEEWPVVPPVQEFPNYPLAYTIELPWTAEPLGEFDPPAHIRQFSYMPGSSVHRLTSPAEYYWGAVDPGYADDYFPNACPFAFEPGEEVRCAWGWQAHLADVYLFGFLTSSFQAWDTAFRQAHDVPFYTPPPETPEPVTPPEPGPQLPPRPNTVPGWRKDYDIDGLNAPL